VYLRLKLFGGIFKGVNFPLWQKNQYTRKDEMRTNESTNKTAAATAAAAKNQNNAPTTRLACRSLMSPSQRVDKKTSTICLATSRPSAGSNHVNTKQK
jgi:hypothetical protein